jgi:GxxExxY protein
MPHLPDAVNRGTEVVIGSAIRVHRALGPGLLESTYKRCTAHELRLAGCHVDEEVSLALTYRDLVIEAAYRVDMIVDHILVVEIKALAHIDPLHGAQLLTYLRLTGCPVGLLLNFNTPLLKDGIKRFIHTPRVRPDDEGGPATLRSRDDRSGGLSK